MIEVFRFGNRYIRDARITTHVFLTARTFGANGITYTGQRDIALEKKIEKVVKDWGGIFQVRYEENGLRFLLEQKKKGKEIIHLTMYGLPLLDVIDEIKASNKNKIIVVGGSKVPNIFYKIANWNVSITCQPHSEISALSVFLNEFFERNELRNNFDGARMSIIPQASGKKVIINNNRKIK